MKRYVLRVIHRTTGREVHTISHIPDEMVARAKADLEQTIDRKQYLIQRREQT